MSEKWMPIFGNNRSVPMPAMLLYGSITILIAIWLPLFKIGRRGNSPSYSLWDLREFGAPGLPLLVLGAALLVAAGIVAHLRALPSAWLSSLAVAETLGILMALSIGFTLSLAKLKYPGSADIGFLPGLPLLAAGLTATLAGTRQQPRSAGSPT
ncbi:hypothetical protein [Nocardia sp. NPDC059195]|uniref:hypothetical protein n=2 Tax=unclassified Nocardia TaxID=2637762 RepID=UPI0036A36807